VVGASAPFGSALTSLFYLMVGDTASEEAVLFAAPGLRPGAAMPPRLLVIAQHDWQIDEALAYVGGQHACVALGRIGL